MNHYERDSNGGVQEVTERYFLASDGTRWTNYPDAYKATVRAKMISAITLARKQIGLASLVPYDTIIADAILKEFAVALARK